MTRDWDPANPDAALLTLARTARLVVALDFDGTISELVAEPMSARAVPEAAAALGALAVLPETIVAFVSGRSLGDLRVISEHDDSSPIVLAGSHGAQYWYPGEGERGPVETVEQRERREEVGRIVRSILAEHPDVEFEPKTFGVGIHGRRATLDAERAAFAAVDAALAAHTDGWRRREGDRILEYASRSEGKDAAIQTLRARYQPTAILFAGDDVTDEDAMRVLGPTDLGIRVGAGESAAALRVQGPQQVAEVLGVIGRERAAQAQ